MDKYNEAIKDCDEAIGLDSNYAEAWYNQGLALGKHGKIKEAIAA
jgi:tetratricopeptide (TPR) repeat protein